jgi:hypothetical protein
LSTSDDKIKHSRRRKDHIAKDLRTPKYRERSVPKKRLEDEEERRWRRYHLIDDIFLMHEYNPLDKDED